MTLIDYHQGSIQDHLELAKPIDLANPKEVQARLGQHLQKSF